MNLNMSLIAAYMKKYEPECHILNDRATIKGIRFFAERQPRASHKYVYLGPAKAYFQDQRYENALLLANENSQIICHGADYEELLNDVLAAFEFYNAFEQRLFSAAASHLPLKEMAEIIESVITWPLLIFDMGGTLLAQCNKDVYIDETFAKVRETSFLGFETISRKFADTQGNISPDLSDKPQLLHPADDPDFYCISMYLYQNQERTGFVLMPVKEELEINIGMALEEMLSTALSDAQEFVSSSSVYQSDHSIFLRLLRGEDVPEAVIDKFKLDTSFSSPPVLITYKSAAIKNYTLRSMLKKELEQASLSGLICDYDEMTVILTDEKDVSFVVNFISKQVPGENFYMGISLPVQRPEQLGVALKQCVFAINAENSPGIRYCADFALPYLFQKLREADMASNLRHPALERLEIYDDKNNTELLKTLKVYIECGLNQSKAAKRLNVHLNTLKYRIGRITDLTGIDFDNYEELFYIQISLAI